MWLQNVLPRSKLRIWQGLVCMSHLSWMAVKSSAQLDEAYRLLHLSSSPFCCYLPFLWWVIWLNYIIALSFIIVVMWLAKPTEDFWYLLKLEMSELIIVLHRRILQVQQTHRLSACVCKPRQLMHPYAWMNACRLVCRAHKSPCASVCA